APSLRAARSARATCSARAPTGAAFAAGAAGAAASALAARASAAHSTCAAAARPAGTGVEHLARLELDQRPAGGLEADGPAPAPVRTRVLRLRGIAVGCALAGHAFLQLHAHHVVLPRRP